MRASDFGPVSVCCRNTSYALYFYSGIHVHVYIPSSLMWWTRDRTVQQRPALSLEVGVKHQIVPGNGYNNGI